MTGYGSDICEISNAKVLVELKSLNHRFFEIRMRLPQKYHPLEPKIEEVVRSQIARGRVDLTISVEGRDSGMLMPSVNKNFAYNCLKMFQELKKELGLKGQIDVNTLLNIRGIIEYGEMKEDLDETWKILRNSIKRACKRLRKMREKEGKNLERDFRSRIARVGHLISQMEERLEPMILAYRDRLRERIRMLLGDSSIDDERLNQEIVFFAERSDITEEIVRIKSHLVQLQDMLNSSEPVGKKIDFILQEIHREVNTIGSKACDHLISQKVVEIKGEMEKLKEQVQNVE